jgi:hypothetical protein
MRGRISGFVVALSLFAGAEASAQVPWESPLLVGPGSPGGWSVLLADPGSGLGVLAHWHGRAERTRLGLRFGVAEAPRDRLAVFGGVDLSGPLHAHSPDFPLDVVWVTGLGIGAGDHALVAIPLGISLGRAFMADGAWLHPYVSPRLVVDARMGDDRRDDLDLGLVVDLGLDLAFTPGWGIRFGASLGDRSGIAVGLAFPGRR